MWNLIIGRVASDANMKNHVFNVTSAQNKKKYKLIFLKFLIY